MALEQKLMKLYPETKELYLRKKAEADNIETDDQFLALLLENYQNPRKVEVSKSEDAAEINRLKTEVKDYEQIVSDLNDQLATKTTEIGNLTVQLHQAGIVPDTVVMFSVSEEERQLLEEIKAMVVKRYNTEISDSQALVIAIRGIKGRQLIFR